MYSVFQRLFPVRVVPLDEVCSPEVCEHDRWQILRWTLVTLEVEIWRSQLKDPVSNKIAKKFAKKKVRDSLDYKTFKTLSFPL